jgi:putative ABC transport system ATP-binding protein
MIAVENLHKSIRNGARTVDILKGISFTVPRGQFVAGMGSSGSGKSTLLGLLAGLDTPSAGDVSLNGTAISICPNQLAKVRGKSVGFVFQSYQLVPTLAALEACCFRTTERRWPGQEAGPKGVRGTVGLA